MSNMRDVQTFIFTINSTNHLVAQLRHPSSDQKHSEIQHWWTIPTYLSVVRTL
jgi:hypothetical protein